MARRWPFLAGYEIAGGLWGLYYVATAVPLRGRGILPFLVFAVLFGLLIVAGILELRTHRLAARFSMIAQWVQVPHIMTAAMAYFCYGPARFTISLTLEDISFGALFDVGGGFSLGFKPDLSNTTLGVNLLPLLIIWYIQRRSRTTTAQMVSDRVVTR